MKINPGDIHVWLTSLDWQPGSIQTGLNRLSPEEKARADRFVREEDRRRYIASHTILHTILIKYAPHLFIPLRFCYNEHGKPSLVDQPDLRFNFSGSHEVGLYAVTLNREVGIDIQYMKAGLSVDDIAQRFFSPEESAALRALPKSRRLIGFYQLWALKEAYIKVIGQGLSFPLSRFTTTLTPREGNSLVSVDGNVAQAGSWTLCPIHAPAGYQAALSVEGAISRIRRFVF